MAESDPAIRLLNPECVWVTAGGFSVAQAEDETLRGEVSKSLFELPVGLALDLDKSVRLGVFSTRLTPLMRPLHSAPCATPKNRNRYMPCSRSRWNRPCSPCSDRTPPSSESGAYTADIFPIGLSAPGKALTNGTRARQRFGSQPVGARKRQTWWIAEQLVQHYTNLYQIGPRIHHIAPSRGCSLIEWARVILGPDVKIVGKGLDPKRPAHSSLGMSFNSVVPPWMELWREHLKRYLKFPKLPQVDHSLRRKCRSRLMGDFFIGRPRSVSFSSSRKMRFPDTRARRTPISRDCSARLANCSGCTLRT